MDDVASTGDVLTQS